MSKNPGKKKRALPVLFSPPVLAVLFITTTAGAQKVWMTDPGMIHACEDESGSLAFREAGPDEFAFDTGVLRGRLRAGGRPAGLTAVIHVPTGLSVDRSHGLVNHYRVFTTGERYGRGMRDTPGEARLLADGGVEALWPATGDRPFELRTSYRWAGPAILDIWTVATAKADLTAFEVFLASYFQEGFTHSLVYSTTPETANRENSSPRTGCSVTGSFFPGIRRSSP